jgi:hypothetical protein
MAELWPVLPCWGPRSVHPGCYLHGDARARVQVADHSHSAAAAADRLSWNWNEEEGIRDDRGTEIN